MATVEQMVAVDVLVRQAFVLCEMLKAAQWAAAESYDYDRYERVYAMRRKAIERLNRRSNAYHALVYGPQEAN